MASVVKMQVGGQEYNAIEQEFTIKEENWSEYRLLDGGLIRLKTTVQKVYRVLGPDGQPAFTAIGDPHVIVRHSTQVVSSQ